MIGRPEETRLELKVEAYGLGLGQKDFLLLILFSLGF
jgi:hypothetical protein